MLMIKFILLVHLAFKVEIALSQCYTNYTSVQDLLNNLNKITFPVDQFNAKCLSQACPSLLNLPCPYNSIKSIDNDVYPRILSTVQSCLSQQKTICSTPIDPIPMCQVSLAVENLLSPSDIDGWLSFVPNTAFILGLSQAELTVDPNTSYVYVNIPNLVYKTQIQGSVGIEGSDQSLTVQNAPLITATLNVSLVLMVQTQPRVSVQVTSKGITASVQCEQLFPTNPSDNVLGIVQILLDYATQMAVQSSSIPKDLGTFIGTIIANAIETAALNCKSN